MSEKDKYAAQKRYMAKLKEVRVKMNAEKYEAFKAAAHENGTSIHRLITDFVDEYLKKQG